MELKDRMVLTLPGQLTWADPEKGAKCITCKHIRRHPKPKMNMQMMHQCGLVFAHSKRHGVPLDAKRAIACSMYEGQ